MTVVKRDGRTVMFDPTKIVKAIEGANSDVPEEERIPMEDAEKIAQEIRDAAAAISWNLSVEDIQDMVEHKIAEKGRYALAKAYILYRYNRALARHQNTTDEDILSLLHNANKEMAEENSNKDTTMASTQRDYIAGIVSRDLTRRVLLPPYLAQAHDEGVFHFHDADYFVQPIFNCCLINIGDMLDNGTMMNGKLVETPKSFQVACTVTTQIIACVASNQYGGQSVDLSHLGKYVRRSKEKFERKLREAVGDALDPGLFQKLLDQRVQEEVKNGVQTIQYQINTLMTTNGQAPFVTMFLYLRDSDPYIEENAMIIEEVLKQRLLGIKNENGVYITPAFPKLVYVLDENNNLTGGKYDYLTRLAVRCSAKRMYPDYISAKKMRECYEGNVFSPMGCVDGDEVVQYNFDGTDYAGPISNMWERCARKFQVQEQNPGDRRYLYVDTPGVTIFDTKRGYVQNLRIIRNWSEDWVAVRFSNKRTITCTGDHPFETENRGVVYARDLTEQDCILAREGIVHPVRVSPLVHKSGYSYDVTTSSEHFEVSGIYSHNCRSFLSPWKDENGEYKFEGRFNQGVVSINLPQIGLETRGDMEKFWPEFDHRLELCRDALMCRHNALKGVTSDVSPIHWQYGAIARLKKGEKIDKLLYGGYSTLSLGYIGLYELTKLMTGKSHTTPEGKAFAVQVMKHLRDTVKRWKAETNIGFALYGTPGYKAGA